MIKHVLTHKNKTASTSRKHHLIRCCITTLRWSIIAVIIPRLALLAFTIGQPLILNRFLIFLDDESQPVNIGYGLIGAYGLVYFGIAVTQALYWHRNGRSVTMLRGVLVSAIFSKSTELSISKSDDSAAVTLMSSDVQSTLVFLEPDWDIFADISRSRLFAEPSEKFTNFGQMSFKFLLLLGFLASKLDMQPSAPSLSPLLLSWPPSSSHPSR